MDALLVFMTGVLFTGSHLAMSGPRLRPRLLARLGSPGFAVAYSLVAAATLAAHVAAYAHAAPAAALFTAPAWLPRTLMAAALFLFVGGFLAPNPTAVLQESRLAQAPRGVLRITRHPVMWAFLLWALAHMLANGDVPSLLFFGAIGALAALGMPAMDRRKAQSAGWDSFAATTSAWPFAAIVARRNGLPAAEMLLPLVVAALLYVVVLWAHPYLSGGAVVA